MNLLVREVPRMRLLVTSKFVVVTKRLMASLAAKRFLTWNEKKIF